MLFSIVKKKNLFYLEGECLRCGQCCKKLILLNKGKPIKNLRIFKKISKNKDYYQLFTPLKETASDGALYFSCKNLTSENRCTSYENRPPICMRYPSREMIEKGGELPFSCGFKIIPKENFAKILKEEEKNF